MLSAHHWQLKTKEQDLNPRSCSNNEYPSVLAHEMMEIEPVEKPSRKFSWKPTVWISHITRRSHDDRLPIPMWETWFYSTLGFPIPDSVENPRSCVCQFFYIYGDHLQTYQIQSAELHTQCNANSNGRFRTVRISDRTIWDSELLWPGQNDSVQMVIRQGVSSSHRLMEE